MLKSMKYEFRKSCVGAAVILGILAALQVWFLVAIKIDNTTQMFLSALALLAATLGLAVYVFISGVVSYSGEISGRQGYLSFMVPIPAWKIVAAKCLYTLFMGIVCAAVCTCLGALDLDLLNKARPDLISGVDNVTYYLNLYGFNTASMLFNLALAMLQVFLSIITTLCMAYIAITLSFTLLRDRKWRWIPSLLIFLGLDYLVNKAVGLIPGANIIIQSQADLVRALVPNMIADTVIIAASIAVCGQMLKKRMSL